MPYIKQEDRQRYNVMLQEMLTLLADQTDSIYSKGEYLGYFINRLVKKYLVDPDFVHNTFNSAFYSEPKKRVISNAADSLAVLLDRVDPIGAAADLNYLISVVTWGFLGEANASSFSYGVAAYVNGIMERVISTVVSANSGNQRDATMNFRRHLVIRGVLSHVMLETNRRLLTPYLQEKLEANGDLFNEGKLN